MPEREFELYLSLLSRFLRLEPTQRDEIADELRDHLEQRLNELAAEGLSREEAIHAALNEFGDAAELAQHFARAAHTRRRRLIMRCTYGTVAALAAALFIVPAFWPEAPHAPLPTRVSAQFPRLTIQRHGPVAAAPVDPERSEIEAKLAKRIEVNLQDKPLEAAIRYFSEATGVDILIDRPALTDDGIAIDSPVSLSVKYTKLPAHAALKLILEPAQLAYMIQDGLVIVTTLQRSTDALEIRVYNVVDLVGQSSSRLPLNHGGGLGGGFFTTDAQPKDGATPSKPHERIPSSADMLIAVIESTVQPDTWGSVGGPGSIAAFNGLLIVWQSQEGHGKIGQLLDLTRQASRKGPPADGKPRAAGH